MQLSQLMCSCSANEKLSPSSVHLRFCFVPCSNDVFFTHTKGMDALIYKSSHDDGLLLLELSGIYII